ncbi:fungal-specific transcription factor domain-containing protein [Aspergillus californicus]
MSPAKIERLRGACLHCVHRKKKCDQRKPQCSRCVESDIVCEPQKFREWRRFNKEAQPNHPKISRLAEMALSTPNEQIKNISRCCNTPSSPQWNAPLSSTTPTTPSTTGSEPTEPTDADLVNETNIPITFDENLFSCFQPSIWAEAILMSSFDGPPKDTVRGRAEPNQASRTLYQATTFSAFPVIDELQIVERPSLNWPASVPRGINPLPADLRDSPFSMSLFDYFVKLTQTHFVLWQTDSPTTDGYISPFQRTLPLMALQYPALRAAALAYSSRQIDAAANQQPNSNSKSMVLAETARRLICSTLDTPREADDFLATIAAAMLVYWTNFKLHDALLSVARSAAACIFYQQDRPLPRNINYLVVMSMLRWTDISSLHWSRNLTFPLDENVFRMMEPDEDEQVCDLGNEYIGWHLNPLYGCSQRLIRPLMRIGILIQKKQSLKGIDDSTPGWESLVKDMDSLEEELLTARECDMHECQATVKVSRGLWHLNEAIHAAASLLLYTRLKDIPYTAPFIRRLTSVIVNEVYHVSHGSSIPIGFTFPLFVAGCEALDTATRVSILDLESKLWQGWPNPKGQFRRTFLYVWNLRDNNPGLAWSSWSEKVEQQYRDVALF